MRPDANLHTYNLDDDWIQEHEKQLVVLEGEKIRQKFEKENAKPEGEGEKPLPEKELTERLKAADELKKTIKRDRKNGYEETKMSEERIVAALKKMDERIQVAKLAATDKDEGKEISLGTSKINYLDPRISVAWCKQFDVPLNKVLTKTLLEKFTWATHVEADFEWKRGRDDEAKSTLSYLRSSPAETPEVVTEYLEIKAEVMIQRELKAISTAGKGGLRAAIQPYLDLFSSWSNFHRLYIGCTTMFFQQFIGCNVSHNLLRPTIFAQLGLDPNTTSLLATGVYGITNSVFTLPAVFFVDRVGHRMILLAGAVG
ncbi:hypothetical protein JCM8115_005340 [Rhodotorula mucilaginosa]